MHALLLDLQGTVIRQQEQALRNQQEIAELKSPTKAVAKVGGIVPQPMIRVNMWQWLGSDVKGAQPQKVGVEEKEFTAQRWEQLLAKPINPETKVEELNYFESNGMGYEVIEDERETAN